MRRNEWAMNRPALGEYSKATVNSPYNLDNFSPQNQGFKYIHTHTQHIGKMWFFFLLMYLKQDDKSKALQSSDMWNLNRFTCHSWEIKGLENGTITLQCSQRKPVCQVPLQKRIWAESSGGSAEEHKLFLCSRTSSSSVYRIFVKHWGVSRFDLF